MVNKIIKSGNQQYINIPHVPSSAAQPFPSNSNCMSASSSNAVPLETNNSDECNRRSASSVGPVASSSTSKKTSTSSVKNTEGTALPPLEFKSHSNGSRFVNYRECLWPFVLDQKKPVSVEHCFDIIIDRLLYLLLEPCFMSLMSVVKPVCPASLYKICWYIDN